jgi:hypothetical protein
MTNIDVIILKAHEIDRSKKYIIEVKEGSMTMYDVDMMANSLQKMGVVSAVIVRTKDGESITIKEAT